MKLSDISNLDRQHLFIREVMDTLRVNQKALSRLIGCNPSSMAGWYNESVKMSAAARTSMMAMVYMKLEGVLDTFAKFQEGWDVEYVEQTVNKPQPDEQPARAITDRRYDTSVTDIQLVYNCMSVLNLNQRGLSLQLGCGKDSICFWINGQRALPRSTRNAIINMMYIHSKGLTKESEDFAHGRIKIEGKE